MVTRQKKLDEHGTAHGYAGSVSA